MPEPGLADSFNYQLIRSKRKTLSVQINPQGEIVVRAPQHLALAEIEAFILKKHTWIEKKQTEAKHKQSQHRYQAGELFLYLGNEYPLILNQHQTDTLVFDAQHFCLNGDGKTAFQTWYKESFKRIVTPRVDYYAQRYQLPYQQLRLKAQKTLWGSCSARNNINLNYLLMMAPMSVIDYVIVHELCHTRVKNHSKDFWQLVESILPNYQSDKRWLKDNAHKLHSL